MIIQSPELLLYKKDDATERIDKYLLVLATFKNGLAFGVKFNERQSKPGQWLMKINGTCMLGGIGDLRDFQAVTLILSDFFQQTANMIGSHYLTGTGTVNFLTELLSKNFEEKAKAMAVNFIVADWCNEAEPDLWFIDFDGRIKQLKGFAVAGGSEYGEQLSKEQLEKDKTSVFWQDFQHKVYQKLETEKTARSWWRDLFVPRRFAPALAGALMLLLIVVTSIRLVKHGSEMTSADLQIAQELELIENYDLIQDLDLLENLPEAEQLRG